MAFTCSTSRVDLLVSLRRWSPFFSAVSCVWFVSLVSSTSISSATVSSMSRNFLLFRFYTVFAVVTSLRLSSDLWRFYVVSTSPRWCMVFVFNANGSWRMDMIYGSPCCSQFWTRLCSTYIRKRDSGRSDVPRAWFKPLIVSMPKGIGRKKYTRRRQV